MLETPEMAVLARQLASLDGQVIACAECGHSAHKFAWYNRPAAEIASCLPGLRVAEASSDGNCLFLHLEPGYALTWWDFSGRLLYTPPGSEAPAKHQLLLRFTDGGALTATIQMWGAIQLHTQEALETLDYPTRSKVSPLSPDFSWPYFEQLLKSAPEADKKSLKFFMISKPGISGVGNGVLQDILFHAGLQPKRTVSSLSDSEQQALYESTTETLRQMASLGGRSTERDLYGRPGGYNCIMDNRSAEKPCPVCGTAIEKIAYLGGACYFCPTCQK